MHRALVVVTLLAACSDAATQPGAPDLAPPPPDLVVVDKAATCAATFGSALTAAFGRLDGTVRAVIPPAHPTCPRPNSDHLILQVDSGGQTYRMVVNVSSDRAGIDPRVRLAIQPAALPGAAFSDGWHAGESLDYVRTLGVHDAAFTPYAMQPLVDALTAQLTIGAPVSVYATSSGGDSAHLVHRNRLDQDGAIVVNPNTGAPTFLLLAFSTQTF
jgi:hypothetical protein